MGKHTEVETEVKDECVTEGNYDTESAAIARIKNYVYGVCGDRNKLHMILSPATHAGLFKMAHYVIKFPVITLYIPGIFPRVL